ncbi:MAG TPA: META domain-containing protein [Gemmatimonadales bacterium]|nr:META domain-containing protein [Gemmatimonadales bacterium]
MRSCILAAAVLLAACGGQAADKALPSTDAIPPSGKAQELMPQGAPAVKPELVDMDSAAAPAGTLVGSTWEWLHTQTPVERIAPDDPSKYTLVFTEDGKVGGSADCNRLMGTYKVSDRQLEFSPLATTRKMCPPGGKGDWFAKQLGFVRGHFFSTADTLRMDLQADGGTFTFRRAR